MSSIHDQLNATGSSTLSPEDVGAAAEPILKPAAESQPLHRVKSKRPAGLQQNKLIAKAAAREAEARAEGYRSRGEMRPQSSVEEDPRARAERRAREIMEHGGTMDDTTDRFYIDKAEIPPGWTYEWRRKTIFGQEDPAYAVAMARAGWTPVPAVRHPSMMPIGKFDTIERDGMILMERPEVITQQQRRKELAAARAQVRQKEAQLKGAPDGQFERSNKGDPLVKISKGYEPIQVPE